ncbi:MAG: alpha/beta fold hydrolase [Planctomycetota bacterium]
MNRLFVDEEFPYRGHMWDRGSGIRMHYVDEGRGDPIVCVHGNPTWSFHFRKLIQTLSRTHRVISVDHVGCGFSDFPAEDEYGYRLADRIDDLERLLNHLGIRSDAMLVAHDWGGAIGFGVAGRNPDRFSSLVAMNTAAFRLPEGKELPKILRPVRGPLGEFLIRGLNAFVNGTLLIGTRRRKLSRTERADYRSPYMNWNRRLAVHKFVQDIPLKPSDPSWQTLLEVESGLSALSQHPLLLLWGTKDPVFDETFLDEWKSRFPGAQHRKWDDCGHLLLDDAPQQVIAEIRSFQESTARQKAHQ